MELPNESEHLLHNEADAIVNIDVVKRGPKQVLERLVGALDLVVDADAEGSHITHALLRLEGHHGGLSPRNHLSDERKAPPHHAQALASTWSVPAPEDSVTDVDKV